MNFEGVLAGLPDAVIAIDVSTRVIFWNSAAEVITGRSARRAQGRLLKEVFPVDSSVTRRLMETLTTAESRSETDGLLETVDNPEMPVSVVTAPLFARDGSVEAAVAVVRDLTRLRQLEGEVRRGETLAAAGRMAVGFAHEIRNPLGAIRGAVQLLSRELAGEARLREYTDVVLTEVDRVNRIIEMLLDLGRPVKSRAVPLNLHQLLERVLLVNEESATAHRVSLVRRYDPSLPPILGDEDRLAQVFHNLVRNALEAMRGGGHLTVTTRVSLNALFGKVDLGSGPRSMVELQVADEGTGIPATVRAKIFDPFFTTRFTGRGLGLATVLGIVRGHRGAIRVESEPGRGSTFEALLPATSRAPRTEAAKSREASAWAGEGTLLVIDDEEVVREVARDLLEQQGFTVLTAADGQEGVAVFRAHADEIRAVLLDLTMPRMGGEEAFDRLRQIRPDLPVILASGYSHEDAASRFAGKELGGVIQKPYRFRDLLETVRMVLGK
jgi:PAS domain S-box-containing protein